MQTMALRHKNTAHKGVQSNFAEIFADLQKELAGAVEKTTDLNWTIVNDVPYAEWVKNWSGGTVWSLESTGQKNRSFYWGNILLDMIQVKVESLSLPLESIFNRRKTREDVIQQMSNKLGKYVVDYIHKQTPILSGQMSYGTASADPAKIDKRYPGPFLGWHIQGPSK